MTSHSITSHQLDKAYKELLITLAVKRRRKGIVIILCVFAKFWENYEHLVAPTSYWQTSNYTRIKTYKRQSTNVPAGAVGGTGSDTV